MRVNDKGPQKPDEKRPSSTGKVYEQLVEDLYMGSSPEDEETPEGVDDQE